jgi:predicted nucleic-acid-binding protein
MKITADTNVLVRAVMRDDLEQARAADKVLKDASLIAVSVACLCEFVWVLRRVYRLTTSDIASAIRALLAAQNVRADGDLVEAGLRILEAGGDFADAVLAEEGVRRGADTFVSFDKQAVTLLGQQGYSARLLNKKGGGRRSTEGRF